MDSKFLLFHAKGGKQRLTQQNPQQFSYLSILCWLQEKLSGQEILFLILKVHGDAGIVIRNRIIACHTKKETKIDIYCSTMTGGFSDVKVLH